MIDIMSVQIIPNLEKLSSLSEQQIEQFCRRWQIAELSLFGSVLREDFRPDSDLDVMVTFTPEARWSLFDHIQMQKELSQLVGRRIDIVTRRAIEQSQNWMRQKAILESAQLVYSAEPNES
jgi:predicted nucleotidyltransferase